MPVVNHWIGVAARKEQAAERHEAEAAKYRREAAALRATFATEKQQREQVNDGAA